ncbi:MAG: hypothetical protein OEV30_02915 [Ignavibacteria bacterium]|nr:hypothetical protein [Ignavibacteria bacterium]
MFSETKEQEILTDVLKEYLTDLRSEIQFTDAGEYRKGLEEKEKVLLGILAKMERRRTSSVLKKKG